MEVLYHIRPYFGGIFPYIGLTYALYMVGTSNESVPEMAIACRDGHYRDCQLVGQGQAVMGTIGDPITLKFGPFGVPFGF